jgi:hypothetical protein
MCLREIAVAFGVGIALAEHSFGWGPAASAADVRGYSLVRWADGPRDITPSRVRLAASVSVDLASRIRRNRRGTDGCGGLSGTPTTGSPERHRPAYQNPGRDRPIYIQDGCHLPSQCGRRA